MALINPTPYNRSQQPSIAGNDRLWLDNELKKMEAAFREVAKAINTASSNFDALVAQLKSTSTIPPTWTP